MSFKYHCPIIFCLGLSVALVIVPTSAFAKNSGTTTLGNSREFHHKVTTDPKILTLEASEVMRTTAKVQIRFIQETECPILPGMLGVVQNVADVIESLSADLASKELADMFKASIDAETRSTDYTGAMRLDPLGDCDTNAKGDPDHAAKKAAAIKKLIDGGFQELNSVTRKVGNVTFKWTPWLRRVGSSGTGLGEVRGTVKLKLDADIDKKDFRFLGGFTEVETPVFQVRNQPRSGPEREKARAQYKAFQMRFNTTYLKLLSRLNTPARLFKDEKERRIFMASEVGTKVSKVGHRSIPFMGERYRWRIAIEFTAGKWLEEAPALPLPDFEGGIKLKVD